MKEVVEIKMYYKSLKLSKNEIKRKQLVGQSKKTKYHIHSSVYRGIEPISDGDGELPTWRRFYVERRCIQRTDGDRRTTLHLCVRKVDM